ncbi:LAMI_0F04082g1_1 [Lachancea mirantina]|uniref:LAMI_0F04082g1_1 n=1 Tax=Lachancea mirantina TaxID=1230905 RepID=A0A1G4JXJ7_9SACH|nr:LAMI_0F04082g1_1 [Lachancea mirantina]
MNDGESDGSCQLLGSVSLIIQGFMGATAIGGLLIKRQYERPRRTWTVWTYDIGKQVLGSLGTHFLNLIASILLKRGKKVLLMFLENAPNTGGDDQCDLYFLNLLMDTTVGIPILWFVLHYTESVLLSLGVKNIKSGKYYVEDDPMDLELENTPPPGHLERNTPEGPLFSAFLKQLAVFIWGLVCMKLALFLLLVYFKDLANWFADFVLGWSDPWPNFQVFLVMFAFPVVLNLLQYFCVDSIIKLHPSLRSRPRGPPKYGAV